MATGNKSPPWLDSPPCRHRLNHLDASVSPCQRCLLTFLSLSRSLARRVLALARMHFPAPALHDLACALSLYPQKRRDDCSPR
jgi:hypothetical protein